MKVPIYLSAVLLLAVFLATLRGAPSTESIGVVHITRSSNT
jgi:hypothetical protein